MWFEKQIIVTSDPQNSTISHDYFLDQPSALAEEGIT
jgi:hypothetical protein